MEALAEALALNAGGRGEVLVVVTDPAGRQIIGYTDAPNGPRVGFILLKEPLLIMEQILPGDPPRVNTGIAAVLQGALIDEIAIQAGTMMVVPHNSSIAKLYDGTFERMATQIRATQAGLFAPNGAHLPPPPSRR